MRHSYAKRKESYKSMSGIRSILIEMNMDSGPWNLHNQFLFRSWKTNLFCWEGNHHWRQLWQVKSFRKVVTVPWHWIRKLRQSIDREWPFACIKCSGLARIFTMQLATVLSTCRIHILHIKKRWTIWWNMSLVPRIMGSYWVRIESGMERKSSNFAFMEGKIPIMRWTQMIARVSLEVEYF